jgi:hypothetical protein
MPNHGELEVDTFEVARTELFDLDAASSIPYSLEPQQVDEDEILDAEDVAAELVPDSPALPPFGHPGFKLQPSAASKVATPFGAHQRVLPNRLRHSAPAPASQLTAADDEDELRAARMEIARLQRQMRARDAYLAEIERALAASTRQLEASGIGSAEDAYRLLGRVRGQAFRIAELESELRAQQPASTRRSIVAQASLNDDVPTHTRAKDLGDEAETSTMRAAPPRVRTRARAQQRSR